MKNNRSSFKKKLLWTLVIIVALFGIARAYYALTDDFRIGNITCDMPYHSEWQIPNPTQEQEAELEAILNQPYTYLGKGAQSYAFASADGQYVIKFFKFKHLRPSFFHDLLPPVGPLEAYKNKQAARKKRKLFEVFNAYKLAYDVDKEESGLIFIQLNLETAVSRLNVSRNPSRTITVTDKLGLSHTIQLEKVPFIVQKRGVPLREVLNGLLAQGDVETAKQRIGQVFEQYRKEYLKGIYDHDHGVTRNVGFIGQRPIHLDVGKLYVEPKMKDTFYSEKDLRLVANDIDRWVKKNYPQYYENIKAYMNANVAPDAKMPDKGS